MCIRPWGYDDLHPTFPLSSLTGLGIVVVAMRLALRWKKLLLVKMVKGKHMQVELVQLMEENFHVSICPQKTSNYGVTCEDKAKRRNSGTKTKTFEENCYLLLYAVSSKEDTAYQRQLITRIRVMINSRSGVSLFTYTPYAQLVISQRYEVNVIVLSLKNHWINDP
ncbi:hypothetical protein Tco_0749841 [Tanacetum coccineum]|uniref:Uncharacterized protein n=1 Tax=Tanacetum coccineum TaxID=301880 RepID=A0ABQ4Z0L9_9ASTR